MKIEKRLKFLVEQNPNYSLLWAQWEFDKKLLSRALNTVSRDFPHYSLHDASHSSTIITQIEKVIAPNIDKLSATDCWLILESCYWHDAGMIITNEEKQLLLSDANFFTYLRELSSSGTELSMHAQEIIELKRENDVSKALKISNSLTFLIADYFRKIHAERSGLNVNEPARVNIFSPRTSLIPQRLFNFVAQIVQCHGKNPQDILTLAKFNDGMDAEDYAHPRYIAALLRIGDLLDIDDGRFCPTLLANIGEVPQTSKDHQEKHASIKHLFINSDLIEIKAECESYGSYQAQQNWFNYIQNEFDYQKRVWNEIVPQNDYRALPTIGFLNCIIKDYIAIDGNIPKITLNSERVYEYITGSQIYSERYPFVREIIQNSVDATIYKLWEELNDSDFDYIKDEGEKRKVFNDRLSTYRIDIKSDDRHTEDGKIEDIFQVRDFGTGMDLDDIKKVLVVGSESINSRKTINNFIPDWGKPSGYFGIGLQTVFKLCEKVTIKTKKLDSPCYVIEVLNKNKNHFEISIQEVKDRKFIGTQLTAFFERKEITFVDYENIHQNVLRSYFDPLLIKNNSVFKHSLQHTLNEDFLTIPIRLFLNGKEVEKNTNASGYDKERTNDIKYTDFELGIDFNVYVHVGQDDYSFINYQYKGVEFEMPRPVMGLSGYIDIFKQNAGYWLTIDRKKGRTDRGRLLRSLLNTISTKHHEYLRNNTVDKVQADYYIYSYGGPSNNSLWKEFKINSKSVKEYLYNKVELIAVGGRYSYRQNNKIIGVNSLPMMMLSDIVKREKISVCIRNHSISSKGREKIEDYIGYNFIFTNDELGEFECDPSLIIKEMNDKFNDSLTRKYIPCFAKEYEKISISSKNLPAYISLSGPLVSWNDRYLFSPNNLSNDFDFDIEHELDVVFNYYKDNDIVNLPERDFKEKYKECWMNLNLITI
ncbi:ATP-binding protein [Leclercia sp.]|uniref:HD domain-containing protein n=1 Tax=Leclercia sp. TaxID=1898428 RepID=UPI0028BE29E7|nr:ATP-binding protein [Leclercia sp.]